MRKIYRDTKLIIGAVSALITLAITHCVQAGIPDQTPLFLKSPVRPIMMLNMSKEHQLFFKLYDDYSDITRPDGGAPDGLPDFEGYNNNYDYYGYFDSDKCYVYSTTEKRFDPVDFRTDRYCNNGGATNQWSGNFLNWGSMTRIDAIRKMLYGGLRSTDTATATVLERSMLPNDAHSFAKFYGGSDIDRLTPFTPDNSNSDAQKRGITLCNTTEPGSRSTFSQNAVGGENYPLIRVAKGNFALWASNERWQCRWGTGTNSNNATISEIPAASSAPNNTTDSKTNHALGDFVARVSVCVKDYIDQHNNERCQVYGVNSKPIGLLQTYGENDSIHFGLMTGSYGKNKSGGVLRKAVGSIKNEINDDGTFKVPGASDFSIIKTIDLLRIYGYNFAEGTGDTNGTYNSSSGDKCYWAKSSFTNGECSNWGNPQAEIYLESLRYLSGLTNPAFDVDDSGRITGLKRVSQWTDPVDTTASGNYCAPLNVLQFNASTTSYDTDDLSSITDLSNIVSSIDSATNEIGASEQIQGREFFVGRNGKSNDDKTNQLCDAKLVSNLASVDGICPESPRLEGGYKLAGLAYLARKDGIATGRQNVKTFGVALAPAIPKVTIPVPGLANKSVTIMPACRNLKTTPASNCAIVDFKIVKQEVGDGTAQGKLYVNWEDSEQGGDFDQDMWGVISYSVSSSNVTVTTQVVAQSTGDSMGFGYVISGTDRDGFHVHSGINNFQYTSNYSDITACNLKDGTRCTCRVSGSTGACDSAQAGARAVTFAIDDSSAQFLESPLYYAAKWGGYDKKADDTEPSAEEISKATPETYFYATDPRKLEESLKAAFAKAAASVASAATVAANSTRLSDETAVYQAAFNSSDWSGELLAYKIGPDGKADTQNILWSTNNTLKRGTARKIYTYDGASSKTLVELSDAAWQSQLPSLKQALTLSGETTDVQAKKRFDWLRGSNANESTQGGLRVRNRILGDIVNSDPAYAGPFSQRYNLLPTEYGSASYLKYVNETKKAARTALFVGANDGMVHAFDAKTGEELFAYIPRGAYSKLAEVSKPDYKHQYLVDGPMYVGDVYFDSNGFSGEWRTIVAGSLGYGGRGVFALDVTDVLSQSGGAPKVIFDATVGDGSSYANDLGYSLGKVLIAPVPGNKWMAVFGNGPNSVNGTAKLIAIDLEDPSVSFSIDTKAKFANGSKDNGLSGIAIMPGGSGVGNFAYGGDLMGNVWKFNLANNGSVAYGSSTTPLPLVKVIDANGAVQPITATPTLGLNAEKKTGSGANATASVMVYFGTGKYYEHTDVSSTAIQSIYGIADTGAISLTKSNRATVLHRKTLNRQTDVSRTIAGDATPASTGRPAVKWDEKSGWFLDLTVSGSATGERVLAKPLLLFDRLILTTFIPSPYQCKYGGDGWLMELTGVGDKFIGHSVLGRNANTLLADPIVGDLAVITSGEKLHLIGSGLGEGSGTPPLIVIDGDGGKGTRGRMSWRQVK